MVIGGRSIGPPPPPALTVRMNETEEDLPISVLASRNGVARADRIAYVTVMPRDKTGFDKYVRARMQDPGFASAYNEARAEIDAIDRLMRRIDVARARAGLSKADLARRASAPQESVRRLLTAKKSNPTLQTVIRLAQAVGLRVELVAGSGSGRRRRAAAHA